MVRIGLISAFICFVVEVFPQVDKTYDYLPSSPTLSELGKYGLFPVNLSTGAMSASIPLYTLKAGALSIPINLTYSSTGIRVDQIASNVGLGWSLNAGGVISRTIRDKDDNDQSYTFPYPDNTYTMNYDLAKYLEEADDDAFDSERDIYAYNFLDLTGKFIFSHSNEPLFTPYRRLLVSRLVEYGETRYLIVDEQGIRYSFDIRETSRSIPQGTECGKDYEGARETAWLLTKIVHPQGDTVEFEYGSYSYQYTASVSQTLTRKLNNGNYNIGCSGNETCPNISDKLCKSIILTNTYRLSRIRTKGYGDVVFYSSNNRLDVIGDYKVDSIAFVLPDESIYNKWKFNYVFSTNNGFANSITGSDLNRRMFLVSATQVDGHGAQAYYSFEYDDINGLPRRLSFAQDHWGMFNGKNNSYLVPKQGFVGMRDNFGNLLFENIGGDREPDAHYAKKGLLKSINYPTGGYTQVTYEGNTYWGEKTTYPSKAIFSESVESHQLGGQGTTHTETIYSAFAQDVKVNFNVTYLPGAFEDPIHSFGRISIRDNFANNFLEENYRVNPGGNIERTYTLQPGRNYEIIISAFGYGVRSVASFQWFNQAPQVVNDNIPTGGLRVSQQISTSSAEDSPIISKYYYAQFTDINKSSGLVSSYQPNYYQNSESRYPCMITCTYYSCNYVTLSSNSNLNLNGFSGNNIAYRYVVIGSGEQFENGYVEHEFLRSQDTPGRVVIGEQILNAPYSNFAWDNGLERKTSTFKKEGLGYKLIHQVENFYTKDIRIGKATPSLVVRKKYDQICTSDVVVHCTQENINKEYKQYKCLVNHDHKWLLGGYGPWDHGTRCVAPGNNNQWVTLLYHVCYNRAIGDTVIIQSELDNLDAVEYKDYAHWFYKSSSKEKSITLNGDTLTVTKNFQYGDTMHLQLTKEHLAASNGKSVTTRYWYPNNYTGIDFTDSLIAKNVVGHIVKSETFIEGKIIDGKVFKYNHDGSISEIWKRYSSSHDDSVAHSPFILVPVKYEKEGLLERDFSINKPRVIHYPDGKFATLLWGYGKKYLIAQVMNKSFGDIYSILGTDTELLENSSDSVFINQKIDQLRESLSQTSIVSFIYQPGVGVISQTDQNKVTTYYEYDGLGRLKLVKDTNGDIVNEYQYNYKMN